MISLSANLMICRCCLFFGLYGSSDGLGGGTDGADITTGWGGSTDGADIMTGWGGAAIDGTESDTWDCKPDSLLFCCGELVSDSTSLRMSVTHCRQPRLSWRRPLVWVECCSTMLFDICPAVGCILTRNIRVEYFLSTSMLLDARWQ
jgi:hypothetical protein